MFFFCVLIFLINFKNETLYSVGRLHQKDYNNWFFFSILIPRVVKNNSIFIPNVPITPCQLFLFGFFFFNKTNYNLRGSAIVCVILKFFFFFESVRQFRKSHPAHERTNFTSFYNFRFANAIGTRSAAARTPGISNRPPRASRWRAGGGFGLECFMDRMVLRSPRARPNLTAVRKWYKFDGYAGQDVRTAALERGRGWCFPLKPDWFRVASGRRRRRRETVIIVGQRNQGRLFG